MKPLRPKLFILLYKNSKVTHVVLEQYRPMMGAIRCYSSVYDKSNHSNKNCARFVGSQAGAKDFHP